MNGGLELCIITQPYSELYWGYFRRLVFGNLWTVVPYFTGGRCSITAAMAEGCIQNIVSSGAGRGAPPSGCQEEIGPGISL